MSLALDAFYTLVLSICLLREWNLHAATLYFGAEQLQVSLQLRAMPSLLAEQPASMVSSECVNVELHSPCRSMYKSNAAPE